MALTFSDTAAIPITGDLQLVSAPVTGGTVHGLVRRTPSGDSVALGVAFASSRATRAVASLTSLNATTGSLPVGALTGADRVTLISTNATPGAQLVRTAAQMFAEQAAIVGDSYTARIVNTGAGTLTLTTDAGATVTLSGTMTVPQNTWRDFFITFPSAATATITTIGVGTYS